MLEVNGTTILLKESEVEKNPSAYFSVLAPYIVHYLRYKWMSQEQRTVYVDHGKLEPASYIWQGGYLERCYKKPDARNQFFLPHEIPEDIWHEGVEKAIATNYFFDIGVKGQHVEDYKGFLPLFIFPFIEDKTDFLIRVIGLANLEKTIGSRIPKVVWATDKKCQIRDVKGKLCPVLRVSSGQVYYISSEGTLYRASHADADTYRPVLPLLGVSRSKAEERKGKSLVQYSKYNNRRSLTAFQQFVQSIGRPRFGRDIDNPNTSTFDWVTVSVGLGHTFGDLPNTKKAVEEFRKEIDEMVLTAIRDDKRFEKFGIPLEFLEITDCTVCHDYSIQYSFEIKSAAAAAVMGA